MDITPADATDAPAIAAVYAHWVENSVVTFDVEAPSAADWRGRMRTAEEAGHPFLVGREDGRVVGYAAATAWKPKPAYRYTVENSVYLAPDALGGGRGRALLERLVVDCRDAGLHRIVALIADGSAASGTLHASLGFRPVGRMEQVGWKHGRWVDVDVLELALDATGR